MLFINHGPWLTNPDIGKITIGFSTSSPCAAAVELREIGKKPWRRIDQQEGGQIVRAETRHVFHVDSLKPGIKYEYAVIAYDPDSSSSQRVEKTFTAFGRERGNFSFLVMADFQFPIERRRQLLQKYYVLAQAKSCDFTVCLGDMLNGINDFERDQLGGVIDLLNETGFLEKPVVFARGNHEMRGKASWEWNRWFASPEGNSYSSFRQGNAAFLSLDSWADQPKGSGPVFALNLDEKFLEDEAAFLEKAVASEPFQTADYKIVMAHGASHSHIDQFLFLNPNMHRLTDKYFKGNTPPIPLHVWICGHIHHYIRTVPGKAECASISQPPQPVTTPEDYSFPVITTDGPDVMAEIVPPSGIQTSVFLVTVTEDGLDIQAISEERGVIDHFAITKNHHIIEKLPINHYLWKSDKD
ncbi:MAG: metallophosphoesterase [Victivallales bacterium]|nr:metallophosphoesterase [Victivallales bacterium]